MAVRQLCWLLAKARESPQECGLAGKIAGPTFDLEFMHLTPREPEKLMIFVASELARRRRARGLKLNYPEAMAVLSAEILEEVRSQKPEVRIANGPGNDWAAGKKRPPQR